MKHLAKLLLVIGLAVGFWYVLTLRHPHLKEGFGLLITLLVFEDGIDWALRDLIKQQRND